MYASVSEIQQWPKLTFCEGPFNGCQRKHSSDGWSWNNFLPNHTNDNQPWWRNPFTLSSICIAWLHVVVQTASPAKRKVPLAWVSELCTMSKWTVELPQLLLGLNWSPAGLHPNPPHTLCSPRPMSNPPLGSAFLGPPGKFGFGDMQPISCKRVQLCKLRGLAMAREGLRGVDESPYTLGPTMAYIHILLGTSLCVYLSLSSLGVCGHWITVVSSAFR